MKKLIKSIEYNQTEIIKNIIELHSPTQKIDCDATYSIGNFYKNTGISQPDYKFDINPQVEGVEKFDCRNLPLNDNSLYCMIYDPPFLATTGKSLLKEDNSNIINKRFGVYKNEQELHKFYVDSMKEAYRILKQGGILIFKCQDKVSSGKQYMSHCFIQNAAIDIGFYPKDLFILLAKSRIVADWQIKNQKNARKFHSYFWVFEKSRKIIKYL